MEKATQEELNNGSSEMVIDSQEEVDIVDPIFNGVDMSDIVAVKEAKKFEIDSNTQNKIFEGFIYEGLLFSMSLTAQINWSALPSIPESFYPITLISQSDDIYILSYGERVDFYLTAVGTKNYWLQSGSMLKMEIEAKTIIDDIINFTDNRI